MSVANFALPSLCLALGFWVAAVRVTDKRAWLLLLVLLSLAEFGGSSWRTFGRDDLFGVFASMYQPILANLWPTAMLLFGIYFPERLEFDLRHPWAKWIVMAPILIRALGSNVTVDFLTLHDAATAARIGSLFEPMRVPIEILQLASMLLFFAAIGYKTVTATNPD